MTIEEYTKKLTKECKKYNWKVDNNDVVFELTVTTETDKWGIVFTGKIDIDRGFPEILLYHQNNRRYTSKNSSTSGFDYHKQFKTLTICSVFYLLTYFKNHSKKTKCDIRSVSNNGASHKRFKAVC